MLVGIWDGTIGAGPASRNRSKSRTSSLESPLSRPAGIAEFLETCWTSIWALSIFVSSCGIVRLVATWIVGKRGQEPFARNSPFGCFAQKVPDPFFPPQLVDPQFAFLRFSAVAGDTVLGYERLIGARTRCEIDRTERCEQRDTRLGNALPIGHS